MQQPSTTTTTEMWQWRCGSCRTDWKMLRQVTTTCCPHGHGGRCCCQGQGTPLPPQPPSPSTGNPAPYCHHHHHHPLLPPPPPCSGRRSRRRSPPPPTLPIRLSSTARSAAPPPPRSPPSTRHHRRVAAAARPAGQFLQPGRIWEGERVHRNPNLSSSAAAAAAATAPAAAPSPPAAPPATRPHAPPRPRPCMRRLMAEVGWVADPYLMVQQLREFESLNDELVALRVQLQEYAEEIAKSSRDDINAGTNMNWLLALPANVREVVILARDVIESFIAISTSAPPAN